MRVVRTMTMAALCCLIGRTVQAGEWIFGMGVSTSCGVWTQAERDEIKVRRWESEQWVFGLLSGVNVAQTGPDFLKDTDATALVTWINNYCRKNPLDKLDLAAQKLIQELMTRASRTSRQP
jgi:hypothetical protein